MGWMGDPPPAPDYAAAAKEQGAANVETANAQSTLNNPNEFGPTGSRVWSTNKDPNGRYTVNTTLSPAEQQKLDLGNSIQSGALTGLNNNMGKVWDSLSTNYTLPGGPQTQLNGMLTGTADHPLGMMLNPDTTGAPALVGGVDLSKAPGLQSPNAVNDAATQAMYDQQKRYLDPQFQQQKDQLTAQLAAQGIRPGSQAYQREMDNFQRQQMGSYGDARDRAIAAGRDAAAQLFSQGTTNHQLGVSDILSQAGFQNTAQKQALDQSFQQQQAHNAGVAGNYNLASMASALANSGRAQSLQELINSKTLPINILDTILNGGKVNMPQFQPYANNTQIAPPPLYQATQDAANYGIQSYNAGQAQLGNFIKAGAGLGSAFLGAPAGSVGSSLFGMLGGGM